MKDRRHDRVCRTCRLLDRIGNAVFFDGQIGETISSHTGRWFTDISGRPIPWRFRVVKWVTDKFEKNHVIRVVDESFKGTPL
jgi:hypothetical protein